MKPGALMITISQAGLALLTGIHCGYVTEVRALATRPVCDERRQRVTRHAQTESILQLGQLGQKVYENKKCF